MRLAILAALSLSLAFSSLAIAQDDKDKGGDKTPSPSPAFFKAQESVTQGSANGVDYSAHAGTLIVHPKDWDDATEPKGDKKDEQPTAEMFYVAYFKNGAHPQQRPVTFLYNGGPGSSPVWLPTRPVGPKPVCTPA